MSTVGRWRAPLALAACGFLAGCATHVPDMHKIGESQLTETLREANLANYIKCELHRSAQRILKADDDHAAKHPEWNRKALGADWIRMWGVKASLKLTIDEKLGASPGLTLTAPQRNVISTFSSGGNVTNSQSQNTALGASLSSDATRTETTGFFYAFDDLLHEEPIGDSCTRIAEGMLIDGDLRIDEFLQTKIAPTEAPGILSRVAGSSPYDVMTYEVTFVVASGASATPTWKLIYVSANPTGAFLSGSRTRTSDLTLTFGPVDDTHKASSVLLATHQVDLITRALATTPRP